MEKRPKAEGGGGSSYGLMQGVMGLGSEGFYIPALLLDSCENISEVLRLLLQFPFLQNVNKNVKVLCDVHTHK